MKAQMWRHSEWVNEIDPLALKDIFQTMLVTAGFSVVGFVEHEFKPYGYSCVWLLAESHLALHTYPEERKTYLEIASCNLSMYIAFLKELKEWQN